MAKYVLKHKSEPHPIEVSLDNFDEGGGSKNVCVRMDGTAVIIIGENGVTRRPRLMERYQEILANKGVQFNRQGQIMLAAEVPHPPPID